VLASDGTIGWPVKADEKGNISEIELMCCAGRGGINRSSDPLIMKGVFGLAREGFSVALVNPIGLYISPFTLAGLLDPHNKPIGEQALTLVRKSADGSRILRAEVNPPEGADYTLDQCSLDGNDLRFGSQIARNITMRLFGVAKKIPGRNPRAVKSCPQFCCFHPQHVNFRGTFKYKDFPGCGDIRAKDWGREAFDIPHALAAQDAQFVLGSVFQDAAIPERLTIGRRFTSEDRTAEIDIEEY
jgi:hypothetical protein